MTNLYAAPLSEPLYISFPNEHNVKILQAKLTFFTLIIFSITGVSHF